jgi:putative addiction module killer protein
VDAIEKTLVSYVDSSGVCPFEDWLLSLRDIKDRAVIRTRLARVRLGNFGNCEPVGSGVMELKVYFGPGYRVYFANENQQLVVLLCGGDKSSQNRDIEKAKSFLEDWRKQNG